MAELKYSKLKSVCLGSEGYQIRKDNDNEPASKTKEDLKAKLTPIANVTWGSFETDKFYSNRLAECWNACLNLENPEQAIPKIIEALKLVRSRAEFYQDDVTAKIIDGALSLYKE